MIKMNRMKNRRRSRRRPKLWLRSPKKRRPRRLIPIRVLRPIPKIIVEMNSSAPNPKWQKPKRTRTLKPIILRTIPTKKTRPCLRPKLSLKPSKPRRPQPLLSNQSPSPRSQLLASLQQQQSNQRRRNLPRLQNRRKNKKKRLRLQKKQAQPKRKPPRRTHHQRRNSKNNCRKIEQPNQGLKRPCLKLLRNNRTMPRRASTKNHPLRSPPPKPKKLWTTTGQKNEEEISDCTFEFNKIQYLTFKQ